MNDGLRDEEVGVEAGGATLRGQLSLPGRDSPVVLFAHGSGSSRHSPRNRFVAEVLNGDGIGTLLFDLLTPEEGEDRERVFDIALLARRLSAATAWATTRGNGRLGYFGASTGAAAALWAAAEEGNPVAAVVSRGGRPDLAGPLVGAVRAPTLLIVGSEDREVLELNRRVEQRMPGQTRLEVVDGASHLFEEPGTLEAAAGLARDWFRHHLLPSDVEGV